MDTILPDKPCGYGEILKRSLRLYHFGFSRIILLSVAFAIIVFIPRMLSIMEGTEVFANQPLFSLSRLWMLLHEFVCTFLFITIIWHMHCVVIGRREPLIEDIMIGCKKVLYLFIATLIETALIMSIFLCMFSLHVYMTKYHILPLSGYSLYLHGLLWIAEAIIFIYVAMLFVFLPPLIAVENKGIVGSLEKSVYLGWNHGWRIFSTQMTPWLIYFLVLSILKYKFLVDLHIYFTEQNQHSLWGAVINIIVFAIFIPWVAALLLVQLKDLELRKQIAV